MLKIRDTNINSKIRLLSSKTVKKVEVDQKKSLKFYPEKIFFKNEGKIKIYSG